MKYLTGLIVFIVVVSFSYIAFSETIDVIDPESKQIIRVYDKYDGVYDPKLIPIEWNPVAGEMAFKDHFYLILEPSIDNKTYFDGDSMVVLMKTIDIEKEIVLLFSYFYYKDNVFHYFSYDEKLGKYRQIEPGGI